jgi:DNA-directed RNA polymerase specialized sigma24 family protein
MSLDSSTRIRSPELEQNMDTCSALELSSEAAILTRISDLAHHCARGLKLTDGVDDLVQDIVLEFLTMLREESRAIVAEELPGLVKTMMLRRRRDCDRASARRESRGSGFSHKLTEYTRGWMSPDIGYEEQVLAEFYEATLASLPPKCRRVYMMVREENCSYQSVANALEISRSAVHGHMVVAHARFRKALLEQHILDLPQEAELRRRCPTASDGPSDVLHLSDSPVRSDATEKSPKKTRQSRRRTTRRDEAAA